MKKYFYLFVLIIFTISATCKNNDDITYSNEDTSDIPTPLIDNTSSIVSLVQSTEEVTQHTYASIKILVDEAIRLSGGLENIVKFGDTVVLKPNIITTIYGWAWPSGTKIPAGAPNASSPTAPNGIVTDWRVVQAVAENVRAIIGAKGTAVREEFLLWKVQARVPRQAALRINMLM